LSREEMRETMSLRIMAHGITGHVLDRYGPIQDDSR
jgi:hypothetical protein